MISVCLGAVSGLTFLEDVVSPPTFRLATFRSPLLLAPEKIALPSNTHVSPQNASRVEDGVPFGPIKNTIWIGIIAA